ncbi:MAG: hypothetical protein HOQ11_11335 [Gemmatimonadaceae bacterium]|nr:hypothetical protein [Gemmatimonadaceae bacterium]NUQ91680.1 hypothetical protein [Gemmatimonadaceae bacterium]NUR35727.1 hypothetical protein [Gemmatimonadaceae bacterium]NUS97988.1 hypothetical protein [Gemmatimonadaceae bacterium]
MARPHLFAHIYGYAVCLTAVIVGLVSINAASEAAFDLGNPTHTRNQWGTDVPATFEEFLAQERGQIDNTNTPPEVSKDSARAVSPLSDEQLKRIYESRRDDLVATRRFQATKSLAGNLLLLAVAIALFTWHWRWLRRLPDAPATT